MKCPLRLRAQKRPLGEATFGVPEFIDDFDLCIEEGCAWWNAKNNCCIIMCLSEIKDGAFALTAEKKL
jgi:hypothetical protein